MTTKILNQHIKKQKNVVNLGKITNYDLIPDLIAIQFKSYNEFLQLDCDPHKRENKGLEQVFRESFPIYSNDETIILEYDHYKLGECKWSPKECKSRGITYGAPLRATLRVVNQETGEIREQEVYFGEIPLMTPNGTFIINGAERVVVSQLHRSPGIFFFEEKDKALFTARIIPYKGSWIEIELDQKEILYVKIDKKKRIPATIFLRSLIAEQGTDEEILKIFYDTEKVNIKKLKKNQLNQVLKRRVAQDIIEPENNEVIMHAGELIDEDAFNILKERKIEEIEILIFPDDKDDTLLINTLEKDGVKNKEEAVLKFIEYLRGDGYT